MERDQNVRPALEMMTRELKMAGYKAVDPWVLDHLGDWVPARYIPTLPMAVVLDANPKITAANPGLPDMVTFLCMIPGSSNPTTLSRSATGTSLGLTLSASRTRSQYRIGDLVHIGYLSQIATVRAINGGTLTIDTDPLTTGYQSLPSSHTAGTPVGELSIVSYAVFNDANDPKFKRHTKGHPVLKRKINAGGFQPVADNISDLKLRMRSDRLIEIVLTALTDQPDLRMAGRGSRGTLEVVTVVAIRNTKTLQSASTCDRPAAPDGLTVHAGLTGAFQCEVFMSWNPVQTGVGSDQLDDRNCAVTGYRIYYDTVPGVFGLHEDVGTGDAAGYVLNVSDLPSATVYVAVSAINSGGIGPRSPELSVSDDEPPDQPTAAAALVSGVGDVTITWDDNLDCDLAGYDIYRKIAAAGYQQLNDTLIPGGGTGYVDSAPAAGHTYWYVVEALDHGFNRSERSDVVIISLP
ncbi:MAG: fibronectin type III domain-containing protein [Deltaproteobacteria bacterium]|nr:fibronectin type III domain-containing protein [Deltaproteobacteria bacterium]